MSNQIESYELADQINNRDFINAISCNDDVESFDTDYINECVYRIISEYCDRNHPGINISKNDVEFFNTLFVNIIRYFKSIDFKKMCDCDNMTCIIFLNITEYFGLEYNEAFNMLHKKIQNVIINQTMNIIGKDVYFHIEKAASKKSKEMMLNNPRPKLSDMLSNHNDVIIRPLI